jgi:hypothetical protein
MNAMKLGSPRYLTPGEVKKTAALVGLPNVTTRVWDYLVSRADTRRI